MVGEDVWKHLTHQDFKVSDCVFPFTRIAILACCLTSSKHADGVQKLITKSDVERLKSHTLKPKALEVEHLLSQGWDALALARLSKDQANIAFGRFAVRLILHLLNKTDREDAFDGTADIADLFAKDCQGLKAPAKAGGASTSQTEVTDVIRSSAAQVAMLQNQHLRFGGRYVCKDFPDLVFTLVDMGDTCATFVHSPLFEPEVKKTIPHAELKAWRSTKKEPPKKCTEEIAKKFAPEHSNFFQEEFKKAKVQALVMEAYMANVEKEKVNPVCFVSSPNGVWTTKSVAKGKLKLFPCGTVSKTKPNAKKGLSVTYEGQEFNISPFKPMVDFQATLKEMSNHLLVPFHWVKVSSDWDECNMDLKVENFKGLKVPFLTNSDKIEMGTQMIRYDESDEGTEGQTKAKKSKAAAK